MTPDELRKLADQATTDGWHVHTAKDAPYKWSLCSDQPSLIEQDIAAGQLIALAPDLTRLCAEMGEALEKIAHEKEHVPIRKMTGISGRPRFRYAWPARAVAEIALAKLAKLEPR